MNEFKATHEITLTDTRNGSTETVPVLLVDGAAYTREEWDADDSADWERDNNGSWTFQGKATPAAYLTVSVRTLPTEPAEYRR